MRPKGSEAHERRLVITNRRMTRLDADVRLQVLHVERGPRAVDDTVSHDAAHYQRVAEAVRDLDRLQLVRPVVHGDVVQVQAARVHENLFGRATNGLVRNFLAKHKRNGLAKYYFKKYSGEEYSKEVTHHSRVLPSADVLPKHCTHSLVSHGHHVTHTKHCAWAADAAQETRKWSRAPVRRKALFSTPFHLTSILQASL